MKLQRNDLCHCESGKKYKKCCLLIDEVCNVNYQKDPYDIAFTFEFSPVIDDKCERILEQLGIDNNVVVAKEAAEELFDEYPNNDYVNFVQGVCFIKEENFIQAIHYFEKAVQINPCFSDAFFNLGQLYLKEARIPEFVACFRRILKIEKKNSEMYVSAQNELHKLEQLLQETDGITLDKYLQARKLFDQAFIYLTEKNYEVAILLFQKVLSIHPNHVQSFGNIALAFSALGKNKLALECLNKALSLDSDYGPALSNYAKIAELEEGEKLHTEIQNVNFYKDGMKIID